ncbi:MAG: hypothetical protein AB1568_08065 [Thermodesulfobacteriota bacterium]
MIPPSSLGFDIDGVIANTAEAFLRIAAGEYGLTGLTLEDIREFEVENCIDADPAVISEIFERLMVDPVGEGIRPMPYAVTVLDELARAAPVTLITARPLRRPIESWLCRNLTPRTTANMRLTATGEHDGKGRFIKNLGLHFFVDDRAETCNALAMQGVTAIVYDQPWNRGRHRLSSVDSWPAIWNLCFGAGG